MLHDFVGKVGLFLCLNMLYSCEPISCTCPVPSVQFSVKMHLTKCHDHYDVCSKLTALDSLQCTQQYITNFTRFALV